MREIKYRAWHPSHQTMVFFDGDSFLDPFIAEHFGLLVKNENPEGKDLLMQYTGLKDRNGVEIYENDIVHLQWIHNYTGLIEYRNGSFCMVCANKELIVRAIGEFYSELTIIGNLHQNPEMLNK